jgi:hypothetical protein
LTKDLSKIEVPGNNFPEVEEGAVGDLNLVGKVFNVLYG